MRKVGISDYEAFVRSVLESVTDKPMSFEMFSDEFPEMQRQALKILADGAGLEGIKFRYEYPRGIRPSVYRQWVRWSA
jgi:hypothetical protein